MSGCRWDKVRTQAKDDPILVKVQRTQQKFDATPSVSQASLGKRGQRRWRGIRSSDSGHRNRRTKISVEDYRGWERGGRRSGEWHWAEWTQENPFPFLRCAKGHSLLFGAHHSKPPRRAAAVCQLLDNNGVASMEETSKFDFTSIASREACERVSSSVTEQGSTRDDQEPLHSLTHPVKKNVSLCQGSLPFCPRAPIKYRDPPLCVM